MALGPVKEKQFLKNKSLHHFLKLFEISITATSKSLTIYDE